MAPRTAKARRHEVAITQRTLLTALLALSASFWLAACGSRAPSGEKVVRVGVLGPFTGPAARTGEEFKGSVQMAFESIQHRIGEYRLELIWIDCQSDPQKASTAYQEAVIRHKIDAGMLNWHSSVAVAVMEVAARYKVPHFFAMGAAATINEKYHSDPKYGYWMAKGWPVPSKLTFAYVQAIEDAIQKGIWKPAHRSAAIWGEDTDWGRSLGSGFRDQLRAASWTIAAEEYFRISETDHYPLLRKFKDAGVSLLAGTSTAPASISAFVKQAREVGLTSLIIADGLGWVGEWYSLVGDASDRVLDQIPDWTTPKAKQFAADFEKRWGLKPSPSAAGLSYDYANFFIEIAKETLRKYGRIDRETLYLTGREEVMTGHLTYNGGLVMKEYKYLPETAPDPLIGESHFMFPVLQYQSGHGRIIWPAIWKVAELQPPS
jgi:branched-chain amino acid transport system substrate-binding protein